VETRTGKVSATCRAEARRRRLDLRPAFRISAFGLLSAIGIRLSAFISQLYAALRPQLSTNLEQLSLLTSGALTCNGGFVNFSVSAMNTALNQHVLVLNRLWQAVNVCTARRALTLLFQGQAQVVVNAEDGSFHTFDFQEWRNISRNAPQEESVRTVSFRIRVPRIILLFVYDRLPKKEVKFTRHNIFERDKNTCQYCGRVFDRKDLNLDHVIPRDRGGPTTWENIVCSCIECNTQKANRKPQEASMHLVRKPKRPKWRPFVQINFSLHRHDSWKHFIDLAYWNVELGEDVE
jgi:5-methylcytosine-specific restriction endonuclease McrA